MVNKEHRLPNFKHSLSSLPLLPSYIKRQPARQISLGSDILSPAAYLATSDQHLTSELSMAYPVSNFAKFRSELINLISIIPEPFNRITFYEKYETMQFRPYYQALEHQKVILLLES